MPAIQRSAPFQPAPIETLKDAIEAAREHDITVRVGPPGVICTSTHGARRWEMDPLGDGAVDAIGALLLAEQPPACDLPDAVCQALGVNRAWAEGLFDGLDLAPRDSRWMATRQRELYMHAYETAVLLRIHVQSFGGGR